MMISEFCCRLSILLEKGWIGFVVIFLLGSCQGCGFQLNRNKIQLPNQAQSISMAKIENRSFEPRLDIRLKALLVEKFNINLINVKTVSQADLVLSVTINSYESTKRDYALDDTGQTYEYQFIVAAELTVYDNRTQSFFLNRHKLTSNHSIISESSDLSTTETDDAREDVMDMLSQAITLKLTDSF